MGDVRWPDRGSRRGQDTVLSIASVLPGEDTFANDDLRRSIAEQLPAGLVGIEVLVDGIVWAVLRPVGITRRQIVRADATLEDLINSDDPSTGVQPLLEALDSIVASGHRNLFIPSNSAHSVWLFALAWLTRDQECRYDHILDWRHARADTRSPVLGTSREQMVVAARALLGVLDEEEIRLKGERDSLAEQRRSLKRDLTHYQRRIEQLRAELPSVLGAEDDAASGGELELGAWRAQAEAQLAREGDVNVDGWRAELAAARIERDGVLGDAAVMHGDLRRLEGTLTLHESQVSYLRGERAIWTLPKSKPNLATFVQSAGFRLTRRSRRGAGSLTCSQTLQPLRKKSEPSPRKCGIATP
jgi:hypothetical protein